MRPLVFDTSGHILPTSPTVNLIVDSIPDIVGRKADGEIHMWVSAPALADFGCGLALDDFGTGFGSSYPKKQLPHRPAEPNSSDHLVTQSRQVVVHSPHTRSPNPRNPISVDTPWRSTDCERQLVDDQMRVVIEDQRILVQQLDRTETRQRGLLADLIHDDPLQLVVAAMLRLDNLRPQLSGPGAVVAEEVTDMLETAVEQLRSLIVTLTPPQLQHGLRAALRRLADGIFVCSSASVGIVGPAHVRLDPKVEEAVYRIVREALVNVRKHAEATEVTVLIEESSNTVRITISDDGVGIGSVEARPGHLGLASMRARAIAARADLQIVSEPGRGTAVQLVVPMTPSDASESHRRDALGSVETPVQP